MNFNCAVKTLLALLLGSATVSSTRAANAPVTASPLPPPTFKNVKYGSHERNVFDLWQAKSDQAAPLFVYIHGGGWRGGDKSMVPADLLKFMLDHGVTVAAINYRYSEIAKLPAPVHDAARAVQFLRWKAKDYRLNKERVAAAGGSAGACTTLWLAYHDDLADPKNDDPVLRESSRLCSGVGVSGQTSIDPEEIVPWVGEKVMLHGMIWRAVGATNQAEVKLRYAEYRDLYHEFSPINHVSAGDPPVLLLYPTTTPLPAPDAGTAIHHGMLGVKLKEKADATGLICVLKYADKPDQSSAEISQFLLKHLMKQ
jgi:arylformamidase